MKKRQRCAECGHDKKSHATEYGKGGSLCRVLIRKTKEPCKCGDYLKRKAA